MLKSDDFMLDGDMASSFGITMQKEIEFEGAKPNVQNISVPGRNGDVLYFDGSYQNVKATATCFCLEQDVSRVMTAINEWLLKSAEYRRFETLLEPDFYRMARLVGAGKIQSRINLLNPFELEFDCKPQKYYKDGEIPIELTASTTLKNLTAFTALPLIVVHGSASSGSVTIGGKTISLTSCNEVTVDCEKMQVIQNGSPVANIASGYFPVLNPGLNTISFTGAVTGVDITPRWWTI